MTPPLEKGNSFGYMLKNGITNKDLNWLTNE
ncbi:TPA: DUF3704 domain-containing protein [Bacillus pseudomycoides]|nr:DUF3704 domain-containing protein [Bacillus pseudomycoides]